MCQPFQLDEVVTDIATRLLMCGIQTAWSKQMVSSYKIRERVMEVLHHVDPFWYRRKAAESSSLWAYTLCLALTPSGSLMVITNSFGGNWLCMGGIDGYNRVLVYLKVVTNSKADTYSEVFLEAVSQYGLPSWVLADQIEENFQVAHYMLNRPERGPDRKNVVMGNEIFSRAALDFPISSLEEVGLLDLDSLVDCKLFTSFFPTNSVSPE